MFGEIFEALSLVARRGRRKAWPVAFRPGGQHELADDEGRTACVDNRAPHAIGIIPGGSVALTAAVIGRQFTDMIEEVSAHDKRHRFPAEAISHVVWLYHRFPLSLRDFDLREISWSSTA